MEEVTTANRQQKELIRELHDIGFQKATTHSHSKHIIMEEVTTANRLLKSTLDSHEHDLLTQIAELDSRERTLTERLEKLNKIKSDTAQNHGNENSVDDDLIEINAGGRIISAKRSTLTQLKGTRFEGESDMW